MPAPRYYKKNTNKNRIDTTFEPQGSPEALSKKIIDLGLNPKTMDVLSTTKLQSVKDLAIRTEKDMFRIQGFNKKSLADIVNALNKLGVTLKPEPIKNDLINSNTNRQDNAQTQKPKIESNRAPKPMQKGNAPEYRNANGEVVFGGDKSKSVEDNKRSTQTPVKSPFSTQNKFQNNKQSTDDSIQNLDIHNKNKIKQEINRNRNNGDNNNRNNTLNRNKDRSQRPIKSETKAPIDVNELRKFFTNGKYGYKNYKGETVIPPLYDEIFAFKEDLACFEANEMFGYIDRANNIVIPADKYECAMSFSEGLACVTVDGKCGYIDKQNETVIPFLYDAATPFEDGFAKVKQDGKWGTIDKMGEVKWLK